MRLYLLSCTLLLAACNSASNSDPTCEPGHCDVSIDAAGQCDNPATCAYEASCPALIDPASLPACAPDAHCLNPALVSDPDQAMRLGKCADGVEYCVPDVFIRSAGKFLLPTCTSVGGAEGRCLSLVVPEVKRQEDLLPQSTCTVNEKCSPCYSPIDGTSTGACNQSCDTGPTQPPVVFAQCCTMQAHCVPKTSIPDPREANLKRDSCATADLCVPNQILNAEVIPTCTGSGTLGAYTGVCLSNCFDFGFAGFLIVQGSCNSDQKCAPCTNPITGAPTGAPGCT